MESRKKRAPQAWYVFSDDLPDGQDIATIRSKSGDLIFPIRRGAITDEFLADLNRTARHVLGVGYAQISKNEKPPEREE
ncbi:hypothetical protein [Streptomyces alfalfae]